MFLAVAASAAPGSAGFSLRDTHGATHTNTEWTRAKAVVVYFVTVDCPVGNSYVPEMNRIHADYAARGVVTWAVLADPYVSTADVAKYADDFHYGFPLVLDPTQMLVKRAGATIMPQAAVFSPEGKLLYLGRIDNKYEDFGKARPRATVPDLRNALDQVLAGKPVSPDRTKSIGCAIPQEDYRK
jgi:peroxiredoxin